jgi:hypothetical protein
MHIQPETLPVLCTSLFPLRSQMTRQPLLKHTHIVKLGRFLDMLYKPSEIAEEIGVTADTVYRSYLPAGLPHTRDAQGDIWIHGPAFTAWARETISKKKARRAGLPDGYGWCLKCSQAVPLNNPTIKPSNFYLELLQAPCPHCGRTVNRARARQTPTPNSKESGQARGAE